MSDGKRDGPGRAWRGTGWQAPTGVPGPEGQPQLRLMASPHLHAQDSTARIMWTVVVTLVPVVAAATYFFGPGALLIIGASTNLTTCLREVGITISLALVCSLISSLMLIPLMSAHFLRRRQTAPSRVLAWMERRYVGLLTWTLRR